jgi:Spy/CpxP family protein refolding chaperone
MRWKLLRDSDVLKPEARAKLNQLLTRLNSLRTARAWQYREQLRQIL